MKLLLRKIRALLSMAGGLRESSDELKLLLGTLAAQGRLEKRPYGSLAELEFKVFSQFGDDGIIQYLTHNLAPRDRTFIEFGVGDYFESNTRFLLQKDNWSGFVMDGSRECIERLQSAPFFWKHDLRAVAAFVTCENIDRLLHECVRDWESIGLLHIDLDGNDYWIWRQIDLMPTIVIVEYNSVFGLERAVTIPYEPDFSRDKAHFSHLYWGSSLKAMHALAQQKGYAFIGCNSAGNNAYFVRRDAMNDSVTEVSLQKGFVQSKYRESRDREGRLSYLRDAERAQAIRGLPVHDLEKDKVVPFEP